MCPPVDGYKVSEGCPEPMAVAQVLREWRPVLCACCRDVLPTWSSKEGEDNGGDVRTLRAPSSSSQAHQSWVIQHCCFLGMWSPAQGRFYPITELVMRMRLGRGPVANSAIILLL